MMSTNLRSDTPREGITRRRFLGLAAAFSAIATLVGVGIPVISFIWPPARRTQLRAGRILVAKLGDLPPGTGKKVVVSDKPVLVINVDNQVKAFSAICTHLQCIVFWNQEGQFIQCPCHDGRFDTNGQVISGPPPAPLSVLKVSVEGDDIYVGEA
jgi:Rieske Fe-S protein